MRKCEPPESGTSPTFTNAGTNDAESAAMRMSHAIASERPAPAAAPFTAAMHRLLERPSARMLG